ncbi:type IV pilin protein [Stenotrophobium rhamnosiphilum]|nr:type IV pilin protein [Stenotrophobium rhamnosiphilum]
MHKRRNTGFSLIELVIVMLVVSILVGIALPSYTQHVTKTRRAAAEACLSTYANYMERFYATNMAYDKDSTGTDIVLPGLDCATAANTGQYYDYALDTTAVTTTSTYKLLATPRDGSAQQKNDTKCGTLSINQTGSRGKTGTGSLTDCWPH